MGACTLTWSPLAIPRQGRPLPASQGPGQGVGAVGLSPDLRPQDQPGGSGALPWEAKTTASCQVQGSPRLTPPEGPGVAPPRDPVSAS